MRLTYVSIVHLTPDGGRAAAALCENAAIALSTQVPGVVALADGLDSGWLGLCEEGRGWARLLRDRAIGATSLRWLLERHAADLHLMASRLRGTTLTYSSADRLPEVG